MPGSRDDALIPSTQTFPDAAYHLSPEQVELFDRQGYLVLRNHIPRRLLARLQEAANEWLDLPSHLPADNPRKADYEFVDRPSGRVMYRVNYLHDKGQSASLELLGSRQVLGIAESLCGPDFVPTYESMVFKAKGEGAPIAWHQDAVHPRRYRIFNVDIYLDASVRAQGALRVLPGSQQAAIDVGELTATWGWDPPGVRHVEMQPGDVLVHDVMLVHGSEPVLGNQLRRTIYYEFRAAQQILTEGPWSLSWVQQRLRLLARALAEQRRTEPTTEAFRWNLDQELRPAAIGEDQAELHVAHDLGGSP